MSFNFSDWWESLSTIQQIYWGIAIPATIIFLLQTILTFVGGDSDSDFSTDTEVEMDHGIGFQFFTFKNFIAFFTIFSWTGIACLDSNLSYPLTIFISLIAGLAMMALMATIFYYFSKLTDSGTMSMKNAVGKIGEVYLTVGASRGNIGKISVKVQGSLRELDAITDDDEDLKMGTVIEVTDIITDNLLLITKSKK
jgi:membrane protein implicated in regulation of membrane protease activity